MRALKVLERFKQTGIHLAIVLDEYASVQGIVALVDLLEGLVGDIPHIDELCRAANSEEAGRLLAGGWRSAGG